MDLSVPSPQDALARNEALGVAFVLTHGLGNPPTIVAI
jgi:hypothetical protein